MTRAEFSIISLFGSIAKYEKRNGCVMQSVYYAKEGKKYGSGEKEFTKNQFDRLFENYRNANTEINVCLLRVSVNVFREGFEDIQRQYFGLKGIETGSDLRTYVELAYEYLKTV